MELIVKCKQILDFFLILRTKQVSEIISAFFIPQERL